MSSITGIDKPRCQRCKQFKEPSELNGYDPLAKGAAKWANAYCRRVAECNSQRAKESIDEVIKRLD
jgi:hypothetical protein